MKVLHFLGADLSKASIDLVCHSTGGHLRIANESCGFKQLLKWCKAQQIPAGEVFIVMEDTGLYSFRFEDFLYKHHVAFAKVNALAIKRSLGLWRGKTDKTDAARIAAYGFEKKDSLVAARPVSGALKRLQMLRATRQRLVKQRAALLCAIKAYRCAGIGEKDLLIQAQRQLVKNFEGQIEKLQFEMQHIIEGQETLKKNYLLLQSIKGVGQVLAMTTLIKTHNFTRFAAPRKFACFCGTAPFEHTSGSSIRGRTRVSHLADKDMKTLLDLSAKSAVRHDKELRAFYLRRLQMGKSKMSTLNIVRNKILYRMFAVIKRGTPFVQDYLQAA